MYGNHLRVFMVVAEHGSFTAAAERLYLTPAAVMKHINALEEELRVPLFERSNRGVTLTDAGSIIYEAGQRILSESDSAAHAARRAQSSEAKTIRLGSSVLNPACLLTDFWNRACAETQPGYVLHLVPYSDDRNSILSVVSSLGSDLDFLVGVFSSRQMLERSKFLALGTTNLCVAVPPTDALARRGRLLPSDLYGRDLLAVRAGDAAHIDRFRSWVRAGHDGIRIRDAGYFYDMDTFNLSASSGTLLLTLDIWQNVHPGLVTLPVQWDFSTEYGLLYSPHVCGAAAEFLSFVREQTGGADSSVEV